MTKPEELREIGIDQLMPDPEQPRKTFLDEELDRLAASIRSRGVLMPLRVIFDEERQCFLIATGESRWRAARIAGLQTLPCIVVQEKPGESDLLADRIVENHVRSDLQPVEFAQAIARLKLLNGCTSSQLARELGLSPAAITRAESLLDLPEDVQQLVNSGELPQSSAYEISRLKTEAEQRAQAMEAIEQGLSRDATAKEVRQKLGRKKAGGKASRLTCQLDGIAYTVSCRQKITWERLLETLDTIREEAIKLKESGKDISILPKALAAR